jgi:hypothetical protein
MVSSSGWATLLSAVSAMVVDSILSFYERRMRDVIGPLARITLAQASQERAEEAGEAEAAEATQRPKTRQRKLQSGTVTAVQRVTFDSIHTCTRSRWTASSLSSSMAQPRSSRSFPI